VLGGRDGYRVLEADIYSFGMPAYELVRGPHPLRRPPSK
jgi:hypothetical protein